MGARGYPPSAPATSGRCASLSSRPSRRTWGPPRWAGTPGACGRCCRSRGPRPAIDGYSVTKRSLSTLPLATQCCWPIRNWLKKLMLKNGADLKLKATRPSLTVVAQPHSEKARWKSRQPRCPTSRNQKHRHLNFPNRNRRALKNLLPSSQLMARNGRSPFHQGISNRASLVTVFWMTALFYNAVTCSGTPSCGDFGNGLNKRRSFFWSRWLATVP